MFYLSFVHLAILLHSDTVLPRCRLLPSPKGSLFPAIETK